MKRILITSAAAFALMTGGALAQSKGEDMGTGYDLPEQLELGIQSHVRDVEQQVPDLPEGSAWEVGAAVPADAQLNEFEGLEGAEGYRYATSADKIYVVDENNNVVRELDR